MNSSFLLILVAAVIGFFMLFKKFRFQQDNKTIKSSSLSLASQPSPSISPNWIHHVFPSFHGPDVRKAFLSHILQSFKSNGIEPFIDNDIERSKSIGPELKDAIRGSRIAIVLLSKNYASSSWCLDELMEIMRCREVLGQIVITIFYDVPPTHIRKQTGAFGKAFKKTCKDKPKEHIERWRKALEDVAAIAGMDSGIWDNEAAMIEKLTNEVSHKLRNFTPPRDFKYLVGMSSHMEEIKTLLYLDLDDVRMIGIWGPPGIGKTTIARFLFHQLVSRFQLGAIMVNIKISYPRPCLDEFGANVQLQHQMLSQMINQKVSNLELALNRLKDKKVLLVLDDVDCIEQLDALAKESGWFGSGSRIIITTEDKRVLKAHRINHIYKVKYPSSKEAIQIFCMSAFGKEYPEYGFYKLAYEVTNLAGSLPLGLKVLGSTLKGMSKDEWRRTLPTLRKCLDRNIESIIKFSYATLSDEEKDLFLYIACFFVHYGSHQVEELLEKKFADVRQSLHILVEKSFISISQFENIEMHTLLQQFGRETSRKQYVHGNAKRRLLVDARDMCDDTIDHKKLIGIQLKYDNNDVELSISEKAVETMSDVQFVSLVYKSERLHSILHHSQKIRSLRWWNFEDICLPCTFNTESLVELDMYGSKLQKLWEGTKPLKNLKRMDLNSSKDLKELPDLSTATNLKSLILRDCINLVELPTIGNAIEELDLHNCSSLTKLPSSINSTNLKDLILSNCSRLVELPTIENATNLQNLSLGYCSLVVEFPAIENATNLKKLILHDCSSLVELPPSIGTATNIEILDISGCSSLLKLPSFIGDISNLGEFRLSNCSSLIELPPSIGTATNIETLNISGCSSLMKLPSSIGNITNLRVFNLSDCSSLVELPSSIGDMANLREFTLRNCSNLVELPPSIGTATQIQKLYINGCSSLVKLPSSIGDITNLREFNLSDCSSLVELPSSIGNLQQLKELILCGCLKLEALPTNINLQSLNTLDLRNCTELNRFPEISTKIKYLVLQGTAIKEIPSSIMSWSSLSDFHMSYFETLEKSKHALDSITHLVFERADIHEIAYWVNIMPHLRVLKLHDCNNLVSLPQLPDSLTCIDADNCKSLERLDCSFNNPNICLMFTNCFKLNQEAKDLIMHTSTREYAVLPGKHVPTLFNDRVSAGGLLTIKLNETSLPTSLKLKACITLVKGKGKISDDDESWRSVDIYVSNKYLKKLTVNRPVIEHIYTFEVEESKVTSTELVFEFDTGGSKWEIGECGLLQILDVPSC